MFFTQEDYLKIEKWLKTRAIKDSQFDIVDSIDGITDYDYFVFLQNGENKKIKVSNLLSGISDYINVTKKFNREQFTFSEAIDCIPSEERKGGMTITYKNRENQWEIYQYRGTSLLDSEWNNRDNWVYVGEDIIVQELGDKANKTISQKILTDKYNYLDKKIIDTNDYLKDWFLNYIHEKITYEDNRINDLNNTRAFYRQTLAPNHNNITSYFNKEHSEWTLENGCKQNLDLSNQSGSYIRGSYNVLIGGDNNSYINGNNNFFIGNSNSNKGNTVDYNYILGRNNKSLSNSNIIIGKGNRTFSAWNVIIGNDNINNFSYADKYIFGKGLTVRESPRAQWLLGEYNEYTDSVFVFGYGTNNDFRKNLFEIDEKGKVLIKGLTSETELSSLQDYIKNIENSKQDKLIAGTGINISSDNTITCTLDPTIFVVVNSLPTTPASSNINKIHLVKDTTVEGNLYSEYLWVNNAWEKLGDFQPSIDLSDYAKTADIPVEKGEGKNSVIQKGSNNKATGYGSHAEGINTTAFGMYSHAEGGATAAVGVNSHTEGDGGSVKSRFTITGTAYATTYTTSTNHELKVGQLVNYKSNYSKITVIRSNTSFDVDRTLSSDALNGVYIYIVKGIAYGENSHAEGSSVIALGNNSHAEGYNTTSFNRSSHSEGSGTLAYGYDSHAEGNNTQSLGDDSHAEGNHTVAINRGEHAEGRYNKSIEYKTIHTVGIGDIDNGTRKNAEEIHLNGDKYVYGIGGYDGTNSQTTDVKSVQKVVEETNTKIDNCVDKTSNQSITGIKKFDGVVTRVKRLRFRTFEYEDELADTEIMVNPPREDDPYSLKSMLFGGEGEGCRLIIMAAGGDKPLIPIGPEEVVSDGYLEKYFSKLNRENIFTENIVIKSADNKGLYFMNDAGNILSYFNREGLKLGISQYLGFKEGEFGKSFLICIDTYTDKFVFEHEGLPVSLTGIATPTENYDAANKKYVDDKYNAISGEGLVDSELTFSNITDYFGEINADGDGSMESYIITGNISTNNFGTAYTTVEDIITHIEDKNLANKSIYFTIEFDTETIKTIGTISSNNSNGYNIQFSLLTKNSLMTFVLNIGDDVNGTPDILYSFVSIIDINSTIKQINTNKSKIATLETKSHTHDNKWYLDKISDTKSPWFEFTATKFNGLFETFESSDAPNYSILKGYTLYIDTYTPEDMILFYEYLGNSEDSLESQYKAINLNDFGFNFGDTGDIFNALDGSTLYYKDRVHLSSDYTRDGKLRLEVLEVYDKDGPDWSILCDLIWEYDGDLSNENPAAYSIYRQKLDASFIPDSVTNKIQSLETRILELENIIKQITIKEE